ncbi:MAG: membrane protein insertion efficiency factor YidD [Acidobacteria bacterium]|nr:membrane protein insertion efficiency factor YidD [Acidobacteriota bacterium]
MQVTRAAPRQRQPRCAVLWRWCGDLIITAYQQHISPYKGFTCPHLQLHRGLSCSQYVKRLVWTEETLTGVISEAIARLQDCAAASNVLGQGNLRTRCYVIPCCFPL